MTMRKNHQRNLIIALLTFSVTFCFMSAVISDISGNNSPKRIVTPQAAIVIAITSDISPLEDGSYIAGSVIHFEIQNAGYTSAVITLTGSEREFDYTLNKSLVDGTFWMDWVTKNPKTGDDPVTPDTYTISLNVDGGATEECTPTTIKIVTQPLDLTIIIILVAIVGAVGVSAFVVVKKKGGSKKKEGDLEFGNVDKTQSKKKGTVYKGASAIGKRSGQVAESKTKSESKTAVLERPDADPTEKPHFKAIKGAFGVEKPKTSGSQLMPANDTFKFETKAASSAAMVKNMELKLDLKSKINFTTSKVDSILSNVEFFKAILLQQEQEELACPTCDRKATKYWVVCPFCEIQEHDSELGLQQSLFSIGGGIRFCPICKRVIQPSWSECPYCFVNDK